MVLHLGVLDSNHRNIYKKILKKLLLQSHLAQMPEIQYVTLPSSPLPILFRFCPGIQHGPTLWGLRFQP